MSESCSYQWEGGGGGGLSTWPGMASSAADDLLHELCKHSDM